MTVPRPSLTNVPKKVGFNERFAVDVEIPENLDTSLLKGITHPNQSQLC